MKEVRVRRERMKRDGSMAKSSVQCSLCVAMQNKTDSPVTYLVKDFALSWLPSMFALLNDVHMSLYKADVL